MCDTALTLQTCRRKEPTAEKKLMKEKCVHCNLNKLDNINVWSILENF